VALESGLNPLRLCPDQFLDPNIPVRTRVYLPKVNAKLLNFHALCARYADNVRRMFCGCSQGELGTKSVKVRLTMPGRPPPKPRFGGLKAKGK
jgi:hypothetical protein